MSITDRLRALRERIHQSRFTFYFMGGHLPPHQKALATLVGAIVTAIIGLILDMYVLEVVGFAMALSYWLARWMTWTPPECSGPHETYTSPSSEVRLAICHNHESWIVQIRGEERGVGNGAPTLVERLRELANSHTTNLPEVAGELRAFADATEEQGHLKEVLSQVGGRELSESTLQMIPLDPENVPDELREWMEKVAATSEQQDAEDAS
jgi:hypothetical protein